MSRTVTEHPTYLINQGRLEAINLILADLDQQLARAHASSHLSHTRVGIIAGLRTFRHQVLARHQQEQARLDAMELDQ